MKKPLQLLVLAGATILCSFTNKNAYVIKGATSAKTGIAVLSNPGRQDTVNIMGGSFEFKGFIAQPVLASVEIHPAGQPAEPLIQLILEPGVITINKKNNRYVAGNTPNNIRFQAIKDQLEPYRTALNDLRNKSYQVRGEEQAKLLAAVPNVYKEEVKKAAELIRANVNFAGLAQLSLIYRGETVLNLAYFLKAFEAFSTDPGYRRMAAYYKVMPKGESGVVAPTFSLPDKDGKMVSLSSFKGKYVLVDFWYHSCVFCRQLSPILNRIYRDLKPKGFEIVSISVDGKADEEGWRDAMKKDGPTWTQLWDYNNTMPTQYGVDGYPNLFLLDPQGKVLEHIIGYKKEPEMRKILAAYIQ